MRVSSPDPVSRVDVSGGPGALPDRGVPYGDWPPTPLRLFGRLGALLAIALGFGAAAQILVGVVH